MDTQIVMFLHRGILLNNKMKKISDTATKFQKHSL